LDVNEEDLPPNVRVLEPPERDTFARDMLTHVASIVPPGAIATVVYVTVEGASIVYQTANIDRSTASRLAMELQSHTLKNLGDGA
jgi:hypothetical protein